MLVRRTLAALAIGVVLAATATSAGASEGTTNAADRALHIRSEALNNAATALSPDVLNALAARSEGLNSYAKSLQASPPAASTSASPSFAWGEFWIGMAAAFSLVLLTGGLAVAIHTGTRKRVRVVS